MSLPHLHLVLNHLPVIGSVIAVGLLLLAMVRRSADLRRAGLEVLVIVGLLTLPVYLTGVGAQPEIEDRPGISVAVIAAHHDSAMFGSLFMLLTAVVAWVCLWQGRRLARPSRGLFGAVLILAVISLAAMGRTANLGGQIRHPDELSVQVAQNSQTPVWMTAAFIAENSTSRVWVWPAAEALHFIGLWLLFGIVLVVNLRLVGMMKAVPFPVLHRLLPWAVLGLTINVLTGMMFVIGQPFQYISWPFYWKMGLLLVAGFNLLYLTIVDAPWNVREGDSAPVLTRALAGTGIVAWLAVMYFGRMLPFLGIAF